MERRLKQLVIKINLCSESEIFASGLEFKVFLLQPWKNHDQIRPRRRVYKDDVKKVLSDELTVLVAEFKQCFRTLSQQAAEQDLPKVGTISKRERRKLRDKLKRDLAVCIYFASYLSPLNLSSINFVA